MTKNYDSIRKYAPIGLLQSDWEFRSMLSVVLSYTDLNSFLEIGAFKGGSLYLLIKHMSVSGSAFVIDRKDPTFNGDVAVTLSEWKTWVVPGQTLDITYRDSHSNEAFDEFVKNMEIHQVKCLDLLFMDGDHCYEGVKKDYEMYSPFVRVGGIIAFHDISPNGPVFEVPKAWGEIKKGKKYMEILERDDYMGIGCILKE